MPREKAPDPRKSRKAVRESSNSLDYGYLQTVPRYQREKIEAWARTKGVALPKSGADIDTNGIRHVHTDTPESPAEAHRLVQQYRAMGYECEEMHDGYTLHFHQPEEDYQKRKKGYEEKALRDQYRREVRRGSDGSVVEDHELQDIKMNAEDFDPEGIDWVGPGGVLVDVDELA